MNSSDSPSPAGESGQDGLFPMTRWTRVIDVRDTNTQVSFEALSRLCEDYWQPLYVFLRSRGEAPDRAADLTQGFFQQIVEGKVLKSVDRQRGSKFRSFLITALENFRKNDIRKDLAEKRGGKAAKVSLDQDLGEGRFREVESADLTPEEAYDRVWAMTIIDRATARLREDLVERWGEDYFDLLKPFVGWNSGDAKYAEVAGKADVSESKVKVDVHRMRKRFRDCLRKEVADTLDLASGADIDKELRDLLVNLG